MCSDGHTFFGSRSHSPVRCPPPQRHIIDFEDPVSLVQDHFLRCVRTELDLDNIHSISEVLPPSEDQNRALQQSFGSGLILMFELANGILRNIIPAILCSATPRRMILLRVTPNTISTMLSEEH